MDGLKDNYNAEEFGSEFLYLPKSTKERRTGPTELRQLEIDRKELLSVNKALSAFCEQNNIKLTTERDCDCDCDCSCCCYCEPVINIERPSGANVRVA